jgi:hypothetical protein
MPSEASNMGKNVMGRLPAAMNAHDVEAFAACFANGYDSIQPTQRDRAFRGRDQVRANWSAVVIGVPGFGADIVRVDAVGDAVWSQWRWDGLYVEPVKRTGAGIDAAVRDMTCER